MVLDRGKGLGKNEDGIVNHVKVSKREDAAGVRAMQYTILQRCRYNLFDVE